MAKRKQAKSAKKASSSPSGNKKKQAPKKKRPAATKRPAKAKRGSKHGKAAAKVKATGASATRAQVPAGQKECLVVGIGASAGGLDSFKRFLQAMPHDTGMALVLIQHLDPSHESLMADLLSKYTAMPVVQTEDATNIQPNCVYMIPPNKYIKIHDSGLYLDEPVKHRGMRMPIDYFFRSLAEARRERAVAIVLSGTGTDGTLGVKEIKVQGGMVMVQKPDTAEYDGMPRSALSTGVADFVLPIEEMPEVLVKYGHHPYVRAGDGEPTLADAAPDHFKSILNLLRAHTDYDFRCYKKGTLNRRIQRRMGLRHIEQIGEYVRLLRGDTDEVRLLFKDLLISVTAFFREKEAWATLQDEVIAKLVQDKAFDQPVRVWVPGCATGEEAYGIAMLLYEQFERQKKNLDVQIFATDLDEEAIAFARQGVYPASIVPDVPSARLKQFFREEGERYRVNKRLREASVFAVQNLIGDPPFSKLDLISCRNVMIYLEADVQAKMAQMFHFALREGGYLFLGNSESIGKQEKLFEVVSKPWRIYRKIGRSRHTGANFPVVQVAARAAADVQKEIELDRPAGTVELARKLLLEKYVPASVLINDRYEAQYFHGPVRRYLDIPTGEPTTDLAVMALEGLRSKLRGVVHRCLQDKRPASVIAPRVRRNGDSIAVRITVEPVPHREGTGTLLLVSFEDEAGAAGPKPQGAPRTAAGGASAKRKRGKRPSGDGDRSTDAALELRAQEAEETAEQLEYELQATREDLQSTIEELETSNEELKASNEEVMSMNEELQSSNEELETSREELQSLNEELSTVNSQLGEKVVELEATNNDLDNLLTSTDIATIFLDPQFHIRRFTPATTELLSVIATDVGRPISDLSPRFNDPDLLKDARTVLRRLTPVEKEVCVAADPATPPTAEAGAPATKRGRPPHGEARWFIRRILPYRTSENKIDGVVITFTDVSRLKVASGQLERRGQQQAAIAQLGRLALAGEDLQDLLEETAALLAETLEVEYCKVLELLPGGRRLLVRAGVGWKQGLVGQATVPAGLDSQAGYTLRSAAPVVVENLRAEKRFQKSPLLTDHGAVSGVSVIVGVPEKPWGVLGAYAARAVKFTVDDVNFLQAAANVLWEAIARRQSEEAIRDSEQRHRLVTDAVPVLIAYCDRDLVYRFCNAAYETWFGLQRDEVLDRPVVDVIGQESFDRIEPYARRALGGEQVSFEQSLPFKHGPVRYIRADYVPHVADDGTVLGYYAMIEDVTDRRRDQQDLQDAHSRLHAIVETAADAIITIDESGTIESVNPAAEELFGYGGDEIVGQNVSLLMPEPYRSEHDSYVANYLRTGNAKIIGIGRDVEGQRKDGSTFPMELSVSEVRLGDKRLFTGFARDITERRRAAEQIENLAKFPQENPNPVLRVESSGRILYANDASAPLLEAWRCRPGEVVSPDGQQLVAETLRLGVAREVELSCGDRVFAATLAPVGGTDYVNVYALDITDRTRSEHQLRDLNETLEERVEQRAGMIQLLHDVASACHRAGTVEEAVAFVLREFSQYGGWCFGQAFRPHDDDRGRLYVMLEHYEDRRDRFRPFRHATDQLSIRRGEGLPGRVFASGRAEVVSDPAEFLPARRDAIENSGIQTAAAFPVLVGDEVVAVLEFFSDSPVEDEERVTQCLANVGTQLGRVVERKRLERRIAEITSHEQRRIGQELHDTVTQQLTGAEMIAESLRQNLDREQSSNLEGATNLVKVLKTAQRQVRQLSSGMMPVQLDTAGLMNALDDLADQTEKMYEVACRFECDESVLIEDNTTATYLYRIAQEAVHNAVKHADCREIVVSLKGGDEVHLAIRDDGVGMAGDGGKAGGNGLRIMRYRADVIGGRLDVESEPEEGTTVACTVRRPH